MAYNNRVFKGHGAGFLIPMHLALKEYICIVIPPCMLCHSLIQLYYSEKLYIKAKPLPRMMTENGLGNNRRRANTISLNERRVTWETCEQNDLVRRKQNRPKRHLNDAARDVLFACEVKTLRVNRDGKLSSYW